MYRPTVIKAGLVAIKGVGAWCAVTAPGKTLCGRRIPKGSVRSGGPVLVLTSNPGLCRRCAGDARKEP